MLDIAYKEYKKCDDIHGTALYPAVMVAPVQKDILAKVLDKRKAIKVFDPFHGSGTALYEAAELSKNVRLCGCDINPLANLITKVKLQGVSAGIKNDVDKLRELVSIEKTKKMHDFPNIKKWFRDDIISDLSTIRAAITSIDDEKNRRFFWYILCDAVRKYSNTRSSTYKLHTKDEASITNLKNNLIEDYMRRIDLNYPRFMKEHTHVTLIKGDTLNYLEKINDDEYDICITSPPYGDNATTVPYGQFSMLSLYWIDAKDLELEGWEFENFSIIDSRSLGGPFQSAKEMNKTLSELAPYFEKISESKHLKVQRFFAGYFEFLEQISRVTSSHIIMTLGNRTVDNVNINLTEITVQYLGNKGFSKKGIYKREIVSKRTPKKVSTVRNKPVSSMNEEFVIVMEKNKGVANGNKQDS